MTSNNDVKYQEKSQEAKRIHVKIYCSACGRMLKHEALDPVACKNFFKIQVDPFCPECITDLL